MGGSVKGLLDSCLRAARGGDNAAVVACVSMASSILISAAVLNISRKAQNCIIDTVDCIPVHKIHVSPATTFTTDVCKLHGRRHATAALVRRLRTINYRTILCRHSPGLHYYLHTTSV